MSPKPRLCHVITRMVAGGAQKVVLDLARQLKDEYEVHVVSGPETGHEGSLWDDLRQILPAENIHVCRYLVRNVRPHKEYLAYRQLLHIFRKLRPDIVHTHTSKAGIWGRLAARAAKVPRIVHSTHGLIYSNNAQIPGVSGRRLMLKIFKAMDRRAGRCSDAIICLSEKELGDMLRLKLGPSGRTYCIPNGIPLQAFKAIERHPQQWEKAGLTLATAGRLNKEKGHAVLLNIFARLGAKFPELRLKIAGDGPLLERLRSQAVRLGIDDKVDFLGYQSDMVAFLASADIFVLSSHYEGFGLVLVEAMAAGLPVVAMEVGGVSEVLDDGKAGILVPAESEADFVIALEYLLQKPHLSFDFAMKGRRRALNHFSLAHMIDAHRNVYRSRPPDAEDEFDTTGRVAIDMHVHTEYMKSFDRDDERSLTRLLERARLGELKALAICDHDGLDNAKALRARAPGDLLIVVGQKIETDAGSIIGLFLHEAVRSTQVHEVIRDIRSQGGMVCLPHPFRGRSSVARDVVDAVDVVEIANGHSQGLNYKEEKFADRDLVSFAREHRKTGIGSSEAHGLQSIGQVRTYVPDFNGEEELKLILRSGTIFPVSSGVAFLSDTLSGVP